MNDTTSAVGKRGASATGELLAALTRIGGAAAALWGIVYVAGWNELVSYYVAIGCPWATDMLSTSAVLQAAMPSIMGFVLFGLLAAYLVSYNRAALRISYLLAILSLFVATGVALSLGVVHLHIKGSAVFEVAVVTTMTFYAATGFLVGELIASFEESGLKWRQRHIFIVMIIAVYALYVQPWSLGYARAQYDGDVHASALSRVSVAGAEAGEDWRMVCVLDQQVLVVRLAPRAQDRVFRIVKPEQVEAAAWTR